MPTKITCYRIDRRDLSPGDVITSPRDHIAGLKDELLAAEERLRKHSSVSRSTRSEALYAFESEEWAKKYYLGTVGWLYRLEVDPSDVLHSADMMLVNAIPGAADDAAADVLVDLYWGGSRGAGNRVELLLRKATVMERLASPADKIKLKQELYG